MKILIALITCALASICATQAQIPPQAFNYSAVARDAQSNPIANSTIGIQISILKTSTLGTSQYQENHFVNTDQFGLFNLIIGAGAVQSGSMAAIDWSADNYYLKVGMDANGGTNFITMGTTQLISVPYALYANTSLNSINDGDTSSINEIQTLSISNDTIFLSDGGNILIPNANNGANGFQFEFIKPYGNLTNQIYVVSGQTINAPAGKIFETSIGNQPINYTYTYSATTTEFIRVYNDNPNVLWITHDFSVNNYYTVPANKIFVPFKGPICGGNGQSSAVIANNNVFMQFYIPYPAATILSVDLDPYSCFTLGMLSTPILTGYLIDE